MAALPRAEIQNTGEWAPIMNWLNKLAGGQFNVPVGHKPPITRKNDGSLLLTRAEGDIPVEVGEWIILDTNGIFHRSPRSVGRVIDATDPATFVEDNTDTKLDPAQKEFIRQLFPFRAPMIIPNDSPVITKRRKADPIKKDKRKKSRLSRRRNR